MEVVVLLTLSSVSTPASDKVSKQGNQNVYASIKMGKKHKNELFEITRSSELLKLPQLVLEEFE